MSLVIFGSLPQYLLHVSIAKLFQQLPVKKRAMKATNLCIAWAESNGMNRCKNVSLRKVMVFLLIVTSRLEYVNIITLAAPRVIVTPYPAIRRKPPCSLSTE